MVLGVMYVENLKFYARTKRFQVILPLVALLSALDPILTIAGVLPKSADVYSFTQGSVGASGEVILLVVALLAGDAVSKDFSREGYFTLTQPVRRSQIMLVRFLSAFCASAVVFLVAVGIGAGFSLYFYSALVPDFGELVLVGLLYTAALTAFVLMFSSLFKNASLSIVVVIIVVLLVMPLVQSIAEFLSHAEPWYLITYAGGVISNLAAKTYPAHLTEEPLPGGRVLHLYNVGVNEAILIMLGYFVISLVIAWAVYSRRELK